MMLLKLSYRYVLKKKSRSLIIIVATCLAAFLFSFILLISNGLIKTIQSDARHRYGDFTVCMAYGDEDAQKDFLKKCGDSEMVTQNMEGYINLRENECSLWSVSDNWYEVFDCKLLEGRYPENSGEILVSDSLSSEMFSVGSTISTDVFLRIDNEGNVLDERYGFSDNESKKIIKTTTYTIVGKYINDGRASINSNNTICIYTVENIDLTSYSFVYSKIYNQSLLNSLEEQYSSSVFINKDYLSTMEYSFGGESTLKSIIVLCMVLIILVSIAIVILIGNAFTLSLNEQLHEFGILSSTGATAIQIKTIFILESLWMSIFGSILGVSLSMLCFTIGISKITPYILSICYVTTEFIMPTFIKPVILSIVFTISISIIAALIPMILTKNITQIELMRELSVYKNKRFEKVKKKKLERFMAERFRLTNLSRFWIMVASLGFLTIILILVVGFCNSEIKASESLIENIPYDIYINIDTQSEDEIEDLYNQLIGEKTVNIEKSYWYISYSNFLEDIATEIFADEANIIAVPRKIFSQMIKEDEVADVLMAKNTISYEVKGKEVRQSNKSLFTKYSFDVFDYADAKLRVGFIAWQTLSELYPCFQDVEESLIIIPLDSELLANQDIEYGSVYIFAKNHKAISDKLILDERLSVLDLAADYEQQKTDVIIMRFFLYFFLAIIFLVCFINMYFTIYSSYRLRENDYMVLQTLGMTTKQIEKMIMFENIKACIMTVGTGCLGTFVIAIVIKIMKFGNLLIPLPVVIIVIIMIITAYIMSHIAVVRKVKNLNMLEKIKEQ